MRLVPIKLQLGQVEADLQDFESLLATTEELSERDDILPFFKDHPQLSAFLATFSNASVPDQFAHEYQIGGSFSCDLLTGDSVNNAYAFIEFEDASRESIFKFNAKRKVPEWSRRFEHGFSQVVDWFCLLDDIKQTQQFSRDFPLGVPSFIGMLVIGRSAFLNPAEKKRLTWRQDKVVVDSHHVLILTFDELLTNLQRRLQVMKTLRAT